MCRYVSEKYSKELMEVLPHIDIMFGNDAEALAFAKMRGYTVSRPRIAPSQSSTTIIHHNHGPQSWATITHHNHATKQPAGQEHKAARQGNSTR